MLTFTANVSRKTPLDGKLEIPSSVADRLLESGTPLSLVIAGGEDVASVEVMPCTCAKGAGSGHRHHFVVAESLKSLSPDSHVTLLIDVEDGRIEIDSTP